MDNAGIQKDSAAWIIYVKLSFAISITSMFIGIWFLPTLLWVKGFMGLGLLYVIGSSITLSKTLRDEHEANRIINQISEAKTEKILKEFKE